jgi:hypothetical protein
MAESATAAATSGGGGGGGGAAAIAIIDSLFRCHRSNADDAEDDDEDEEGEDEVDDEERRRGGGSCRAASDAQPRRSLQPVVARLGGHWSSSSTEFLDEAATDHHRQSGDLLEDRNSELLWPQQRPRLISSAESVTEQHEDGQRETRPKPRLNQPVVGGWDSEQPLGAAEDQEQPAMVAGIPPLSSPDPSLSSIREAERPR